MQEIDSIKEQISPVLVEAKRIQVVTADSYNLAAEFLKEVKAAQRKVINFFGPHGDKDIGIKAKAHQAWKSIVALEKKLLDPLEGAETSVKQKMLIYTKEERDKAIKEQLRLQAEADARAMRDREKLLKEAANLKTPELQEQRLAEAEEVEAPVITVQTETPRVDGISTRKTWKAEVVDKNAFINAAVNESAYHLLPYIILDEKALNKVAQATKGQLSYPGIKFYQEETMAAGRG